MQEYMADDQNCIGAARPHREGGGKLTCLEKGMNATRPELSCVGECFKL